LNHFIHNKREEVCLKVRAFLSSKVSAVMKSSYLMEQLTEKVEKTHFFQSW
jgi:hypothetical protein